MDDLIRRQAAIIQLSHNKIGDDDCDVIIQRDIETIKQLPSAEPKTSKWVDNGDPLMLTCGNCGYGVMRYNNTPFCPHCGNYNGGQDETD